MKAWLARRARALKATIAALIIVAASLVSVAVTAGPASADVSAPSWWNGTTCDTANYPGSYPLGASYDGVITCGPGPYNQGGTDHLVHFFSGAWGEYEWECVELVMRYMYQVYGINPYSAPGGKDVVDNYGGSALTKVTNDGTSTNVKVPSPGDIISVGAAPVNPNTGKSPNLYGHTAVVTGVSVTNGSGTITVMQENATADGWGTVSVSNGKVTGTQLGAGGSVTGWLHNPSAGSPTPPPDADGDGTPDSQDVAPTIPGPMNNRGVPDYSPRVSGDFNGDGKTDIAAFYDFGGGTTKLFVFYGNGAGSFGAPTTAWDSGPGGWGWANTKPVVGDFNGDGYTDIAAFYDFGGYTTQLFLFTGTATGFNPPVSVWNSGPGGWGWSNTLQVSGDFNGDGKIDIAAFYDFGGYTTQLFVFYGNGNGTFSAPVIGWDSGPGNWGWVNAKPIVGDFNGDGKIDIAAFYDFGGGTTQLFLFTGSATGFNPPVSVWNSGPGGWNWADTLQASGDFNGDGKIDIAAFYGFSGYSTKLFVFYGNGAGSFSTPATAWDSGPGNWGWNNAKPVVGDFNGDGKIDIAAFYDFGSATTQLFLFTGTATGFNSPVSVWNSGPGGWNWNGTLVA